MFQKMISTTAENQSSHRQGIENKVISSDVTNANRGMIFGFIIGLFGIAGGVFLIYNGINTLGGLLAFGTIGSLVGTFVYGTHQRQTERKMNLQQPTEEEPTEEYPIEE